MKSYVYCITNLINGKRYIGKSNYPEARWRKHQRSVDGYYLHSSIRKYGIDNFEFEVIAEFSSEEAAFLAENKLIAILRTNDKNRGYNLNEGGRGGSNPSPETRKRMGQANIGRKHTEEWKQQNSARQKGKIRSEETRKNIAAGLLGKKLSDDHRSKLRGKKRNPEQVENIRRSIIGRKMSQETRDKMSQSAKAAWDRRKNRDGHPE